MTSRYEECPACERLFLMDTAATFGTCSKCRAKLVWIFGELVVALRGGVKELTKKRKTPTTGRRFCEKGQRPMKHELKTWPDPFNAVVRGIKTAEFRKDDRGFHVGDYLGLREWHPEKGYSGRCYTVEVSDLTTDSRFGIPEGYCMLSIRPVTVRPGGGLG